MIRRPSRAAAFGTASGFLLTLSGMGPASAATVVVQSKAPYWDVGVNDPVLSQMCAVGQFNQKSIDLYVARFVGDDGQAVLGIAKGTGVNLYDPKHAAKKNEDYFFRGDGTSSCAVFVGGRKPPPKPGDKTPGAAGAGTTAAAAQAAPAPVTPGPATPAAAATGPATPGPTVPTPPTAPAPAAAAAANGGP